MDLARSAFYQICSKGFEKVAEQPDWKIQLFWGVDFLNQSCLNHFLEVTQDFITACHQVLERVIYVPPDYIYGTPQNTQLGVKEAYLAWEIVA